MRTLVVSDLHLGSHGRSDVLRRPGVREPLLRALDGVDRLVLLGDALELRHGPVHAVLEAARPLFEELGRALGDAEVVLVPGNHDHALLVPWLERRRAEGPRPLGLEEAVPADAGAATAQLARWLAPAHLSLAYPGVCLRPDVYAIHGHYVDCHLTVPTFERLGAALMARMVGDPRRDGARPDSYEAALTPIYSWIHSLAQQARGGDAAAAIPELSAGVWRRLAGRGRRGPGARLAASAAVPAAVAVVNRLGLGPFRSDLSGPELRRAGLAAMREVVAGLGVRADHVVFGHTHRTGPLPGDDLAEWTVPGGARLVNAGNWIYSRHFLTADPGESPYWPGGCVVVEDEGPPRLRRLLQDRSHPELAPAVR